MLTEQRHKKLNPILDELRMVEGVSTVQVDDYDSGSVNVFIWLQSSVANETGHYRLVSNLIKVKRNINKILGENGDFLHWPTMQYHWLPKMPGLPRERVEDGYDCNHIKLEIYV